MDKRLVSKISEYSNLNILKVTPLIVNNRSINKTELAIIAQDLQGIEPLLISQQSNGNLVVDYEKLTVALLAVVQDQQKQIDDLRKKITAKKK